MLNYCKILNQTGRNLANDTQNHTQPIEQPAGIELDSGKILSLSQNLPYRMHDFCIRKEEAPLPPKSGKTVDLDYQGLQKQIVHAKLSIKRSKKQSLNSEQKQYNKQQVSFRINVKHKIRALTAIFRKTPHAV